ncbi:MAG: signal recognition particle-docking protein FtsY [Candidatus Micrarchaeota archaeon]
MFDFLKKKIANFVNTLTGKEEKLPEVAEEKIEELPEEKIEDKPAPPKAEPPKPAEKKEEPKKVEEKKPVPKIEEKKAEERKPAKAEKKPEVAPKVEKKPEMAPAPKHVEAPKPIPTPKPVAEIPKTVEKPMEKAERPVEIPKEPEVKTPKVSLSFVSTVKSIFTGEVEIKEQDVRETLDALEMGLIEGDVSIEIAESIIAELRDKLIGNKIQKGKLNEFIKQQIIDTLKDAMTTGSEFEVVQRVKATNKPVKILFLGINGAGKTTTIAKVATLLMKNGLTVVVAGADTFRAAALEQLEIHANKLGVKMIKRDYGSDPTSVAFDAVTYATAHGIDAVLIDTAGRQETNVNLMNELKKIERVIKPDLKLYVGESIGGSAVLEQVRSFNSEVGIDGIVLTKLDCDAKGGTVISAAKATGVPIVLIGTGQKYEDMEDFQPNRIISRLMG